MCESTLLRQLSFVNIKRTNGRLRTIFNLSLLILFLVGENIVINAQVPADAPLDFDGDGRTDYCVVRALNNQLVWYIQPANGSPLFALNWGILGDVATPEDFDGDGRDDIAVWRPTSNSAFFYILQSQTNTVRVAEFGRIGDDPSVVADYDGDNRADPAVYRNPSPGGQSYFYYLGSLNNPTGNITYIPWGTNGDYPAPGDYDGDGRGDFVVQRNSNGASFFYLLQSSAGISVLQFGLATDLIATGDYDGDRKTDFCVVRQENINLRWWIRRSSDAQIINHPFGLTNLDFVAQGDYNGDGITDLSIWRPNPDPTQNYFYVRSSANGQVSRTEWGIGTDYPAANFNVH
jgi:hypothetical protein